MSFIILLAIIIPLISGIIVNVFKNEKALNKNIFLLVSTIVTFALTLINCLITDARIEVFKLTNDLTILFKVDGLSKTLTVLISFVWILVTIYTFEYIKHEKDHNRFYMFSMFSLATLISLSYAGNLLTLYLCFEFVTLMSMPLVLHSLTKESIQAAMKYLFYSIGGAFLALFGIFLIIEYTNNIEFLSYGGSGLFDSLSFTGNKSVFQIAIFLLIIGFGSKAGMFPLHGWLTSAHPVAPSPASALLSGIIAKAGVIAIIRVIYYVVGVDFLRGTWVQYAWLALALFTIVMGSLLAYVEQNIKKRLAYSTISQISYILAGLAIMTSTSFKGAILHLIVHMLIKVCLFLFAGEVIYKKGYHKVSQLKGIGKIMPISTWAYTIASLGLIGIPLTGGFVSKWYLASGAITSNTSVFDWLMPVCLLVSAILTAGYLLPISIKGFIIGESSEYVKDEPSKLMYIPLIVLSLLIVFIGVYSDPLIKLIDGIIGG